MRSKSWDFWIMYNSLSMETKMRCLETDNPAEMEFGAGGNQLWIFTSFQVWVQVAYLRQQDVWRRGFEILRGCAPNVEDLTTVPKIVDDLSVLGDYKKRSIWGVRTLWIGYVFNLLTAASRPRYSVSWIQSLRKVIQLEDRNLLTTLPQQIGPTNLI